MRVTQEDDRLPGVPILIVAGLVIVIVVGGSLAAFFLGEQRNAELEHVRGGVPHVEILPTAVPAVVPGQVPEEVNRIEQVLFDDRAPGLEERAFEQERLRTYGWVDREARLVRIPIDRAIELYVQEARPAPGAVEVTP